MYGWGGFGHMGWLWLLGVALLVFLVWSYTTGRREHGPPAAPESPEQILKQRYARGEVGRDEFERRLSDLRR